MTVTYPIFAIRDNTVRVVVDTILVVIASASIALRLWSRQIRRVRPSIDDYAIILAMFLLYSLYVMSLVDVTYGMRRDIATIPSKNLTVLLKMLIPYQLLYGTTMLAVKLSYLTFYLRIFGHKESFKMWTRCLAATVTAWWLANVLQIFLICRPLGLNWDPTIPGVCGNRPLGFVLLATFNIITDVAVIALPLPYVRRLQMPTQKKWGVAFMFSIGLFITVISGIRLGALSHLDFTNISYNMLDSVFWTVVEPSVAIINACLPMLRPSLSRLAPGIFSSSSQHQTPQHNTSRDFGSARRPPSSSDEFVLLPVGGPKILVTSTEDHGSSITESVETHHGTKDDTHKGIWKEQTVTWT